MQANLGAMNFDKGILWREGGRYSPREREREFWIRWGVLWWRGAKHATRRGNGVGPTITDTDSEDLRFGCTAPDGWNLIKSPLTLILRLDRLRLGYYLAAQIGRY